MITEHWLTEAFFQGFTKRILYITVPLALLAAAGGWYASKSGSDAVSISALVLVVAVLAFTLARTLRQQKRSFRTFRIQLEDDRLVRLQDGYPRLEIAFTEITKLTEHTNQGLSVQGEGSHQQVFLFALLERYDELRDRLALHHPIETSVPNTWSIPKLLGVMLVPVIAVIIVFRSNSPLPVLLAGCVALVSLVGCAIALARNPQVESRTKRGLWWLIPVCLSIGIKMWFVVCGWK